MKRDDIVVMEDHGSQLWCVLACGPKTFDIIAYSGYVERHRHGARTMRAATAEDFHGSEEHQTAALRAEAAKAREERRMRDGIRRKRGQVWPSH